MHHCISVFSLLLLFLCPLSHSWSTTISFHLYHHFDPIVPDETRSPFVVTPIIRPAPLLLANGLCTQVPPGFCCRALTAQTYEVDFVGLPLGAIAAIWQSQGILVGCEGRVLETRYGLPRWNWRDTAEPPRISAACYILCPERQYSGWTSTLAGLCLKLKKRHPAAELAWGFPDIITFNGSNYTDERRGDLMYRNSSGALLNLTTLYQ